MKAILNNSVKGISSAANAGDPGILKRITLNNIDEDESGLSFLRIPGKQSELIIISSYSYGESRKDS